MRMIKASSRLRRRTPRTRRAVVPISTATTAVLESADHQADRTPLEDRAQHWSRSLMSVPSQSGSRGGARGAGLEPGRRGGTVEWWQVVRGLRRDQRRRTGHQDDQPRTHEAPGSPTVFLQENRRRAVGTAARRRRSGSTGPRTSCTRGSGAEPAAGINHPELGCRTPRLDQNDEKYGSESDRPTITRTVDQVVRLIDVEMSCLMPASQDGIGQNRRMHMQIEPNYRGQSTR